MMWIASSNVGTVMTVNTGPNISSVYAGLVISVVEDMWPFSLRLMIVGAKKFPCSNSSTMTPLPSSGHDAP